MQVWFRAGLCSLAGLDTSIQGQSFPQVVSTLLGAPNAALKGGEMGSHQEEGFPQSGIIGAGGAALLPGRELELQLDVPWMLVWE